MGGPTVVTNNENRGYTVINVLVSEMVQSGVDTVFIFKEVYNYGQICHHCY